MGATPSPVHAAARAAGRVVVVRAEHREPVRRVDQQVAGRALEPDPREPRVAAGGPPREHPALDEAEGRGEVAALLGGVRLRSGPEPSASTRRPSRAPRPGPSSSWPSARVRRCGDPCASSPSHSRARSIVASRTAAVTPRGHRAPASTVGCTPARVQREVHDELDAQRRGARPRSGAARDDRRRSRARGCARARPPGRPRRPPAAARSARVAGPTPRCGSTAAGSSERRRLLGEQLGDGRRQRRGEPVRAHGDAEQPGAQRPCAVHLEPPARAGQVARADHAQRRTPLRRR